MKKHVVPLIIKGLGILVILGSIVLIGMDVFLEHSRMLKGVNKKFGSLAEYGAIAAGSLWLVRQIWLYVHKRKIVVSKYMKELYSFLKQYHIWIGYAVLSTSAAHGIYFLMRGTRNLSQYYSGVASLIGIVLVTIAGFTLQNLKNKKKYVTYRKIHQLVVVLFGIGLLVHIMV